MYGQTFLKSCLVLLALAALLALTPARSLHAASLQEDRVVLGDDFTLSEGEQIRGDLVLMGGNLVTRSDSRVEGSVTAFGGRVEVNGTVEGDLVAFGGDVHLGARALIRGDVVALGGRVYRSEGARTGEVIEGAGLPPLRFWRDVRLPLFSGSLAARPLSNLLSATAVLLGGLTLALLGAAVAHFWPGQTVEVGRTILTAPLPSLGAGCLLYPLAAMLTVVILVSICLAPFVPFVALLFVMANLFGWIALGTLWGRWLVRRLGWRRATLAGAAGTGVFALTVVAALIGAVPGIGPLIVLAASSVGLGAVALSRFGNALWGRDAVGPPQEV